MFYRWFAWLLPVLALLVLAACTDSTATTPTNPTAPPVTAEPTEEPEPTPVELDATLELTGSGLRVSYPQGWQTRTMSQTVVLAPSTDAMDANQPGDELVVTIDAIPVRLLAEQYSNEDVSSLEGLFVISSRGPQEAGYTLGDTESVTVDDEVGIAAPMEAAGGTGRLVVISRPPQMVRIIGQAAPAAWEEQQDLFERIVDSLTFSAPIASGTPTPAAAELQPVITTEGPPEFVLRLGGSEGSAENRFVSVRGLDTSEDGTLYVAESSRGVWVFSPEGELQQTFGATELLDAYDVAVNEEGNVFVADYGNNAIARFRPDGTQALRWGQTGEEPGQFGLQAPQRLALGPDGSVYALDVRVDAASGNAVSSVVHFSDQGAFLERIDLPAGAAPNDLALDSEGNIYLADTANGAVTKITPQGEVLALFGRGITPGAVDVDESGTIYAATWGSGVLKFAADGTLLAEAGQAVDTGTIPQPGQFSLPNGVTAAPGQVVWVSDNAGEYSAITALRLVSPEAQPTEPATDPAAEPPDEAGPTAEPTPIPEAVLIEQWASGASASSSYSEDYAPENATGEPDVEGCRSSDNAWAPVTPGSEETLRLTFDEPVLATGVRVFESHQPGAITLIELQDEEGEYITVYEGEAELLDECPRVLTVEFDPTSVQVDALRITLDQSSEQWNEIDAVQLIGLQ